MRRQHEKLFAVAECELTPDDLEVLSEHGPLRWSASTSRLGRGPLTITECSLTPTPASVGLHAVTWHRAGVSNGNMPAWVRADVDRGRHDLNRRAPMLEVYERRFDDWRVGGREAAAAHMRRGTVDRFDPREMHYSGGGYVVAVNGRPPRRA